MKQNLIISILMRKMKITDHVMRLVKHAKLEETMITIIVKLAGRVIFLNLILLQLQIV
jgi:hypothetical protein